MVVQLENVSLKKNGKWILQEVNWNIKKGEHWVLFGLNGAGKTALLHMLNAYSFPTRGKVQVVDKKFGEDILGEELRTRIGLVSSALQQKLNLTDTPYEIVLSGAYAAIRLYQIPSDEIKEKAVKLLTELGCKDYMDREYGSLSQGERQRVLIARALMTEPDLLILDEPTNGLDFVGREQLLETIDHVASSKNAPTMIYVTHHVEEILPVFTKTLLLSKGKVFQSGKTTDLITSSVLSEFFKLPVDVLWENGRPLLSKRKSALLKK